MANKKETNIQPVDPFMVSKVKFHGMVLMVGLSLYHMPYNRNIFIWIKKCLKRNNEAMDSKSF